MHGGSLEVVRSIYADWVQGDFGRSDWADPEIEFDVVGGPDSAEVRGIAAMNDAWRDWLRGWVGFRVEAVDYRVIDEDRILVHVRNFTRGRLSDLELEQQSVCNYFELERGLVTKLVVYLDGARALADLGLETG
jgi:hypothetical protein